MRLPLRQRAIRALAALALAMTTILPAALPVAAQEEHILRVGTDQDLEVLNPWQSVVVVDYEIYTLNYDLLVGFGQDLAPAPGFADEWESSEDGRTHTFHIREGMTWSDGEPATCADAEYTFNLVLEAYNSEAGYIGSGYLEPYLTNAGLSAVECQDENTFVATTEFPTTLLTQAYVPILPEHIWSEYSLEQIGFPDTEGYFANEPPVVGTGPYQAVEWQPGEFVRFERNESYWGQAGGAEEIIIEKFADSSTMSQALQTGAVDYVRGVLPDQFDALQGVENVQTVEGFANGYSELAFNTRGNTQGAGGSTAALTDPAFRDALGYAIDQERLVETTLGGHGVPGDTIVPPYHADFHVTPDTPRRFDLVEADRRLVAAGYVLNGQDQRLDLQGNPLNLRLTWPASEEEHATNADFIRGWFGELGIGVEASVTEDGALIDALVPAEGDGPADFDMFIWGWVGDPDPQSLLSFFITDQIGGLNDSFFSNERYDELFGLQQQATDLAQRKEYIAEMQNLIYDQAPYHVLYYDSELHAYRTDKFTNWQNQPPDSGTPLFGYGPVGYTLLQQVGAASPEPSTSGGPAPSGASPAPSTPTDAPASANNAPILIGALVLVGLAVVGTLVLRGRRASAEEE